MIYFELYHGRPIDPETGDHPDMEDWGDEGPVFEVDRVITDYCSGIRLIVGDFDKEFCLNLHEDLVYYDGIGYGGFMVTADDSLIETHRIQEFDTEKAGMPKFPKKEAAEPDGN